jgi:hypothetical protein
MSEVAERIQEEVTEIAEVLARRQGQTSPGDTLHIPAASVANRNPCEHHPPRSPISGAQPIGALLLVA